MAIVPHGIRSPRTITKRAMGWLGGLTASGGLLDAILAESRSIAVTRPTAPVPGLPPAWDGARVALLTDLHVGPLCGLPYIRRVVELTNSLSPDLVVLAGDHVSCPRAVQPALSRVLSRLRAPEGRFAVMGNHDWYCGGERVVAMLREAGIDVLVNAHRLLWRRGQGLCIAGVDDWNAGWSDPAAALADADGCAPRILITHNPDALEDLPPQPRVDFALCGHTHGGQIRLPFGWLPYLPLVHRKYLAGHVAGPRCRAYVSRGIGMVCVPVRLNCPPELPLITLRQASAVGPTQHSPPRPGRATPV